MMPVTTGDRLLAALARRGWAWLAVLGCVSLALTGGVLLLPAAVGHALDAAIAHSGSGGWLIACALLVVVFVCSEAVTVLATGIAGAAATARLRERLAAHVLAVGPRLAGSGADSSADRDGVPSADRGVNHGGGQGADQGADRGVNDGADRGVDHRNSGDTVSRIMGGAADAGTGPASVVTAIAATIPPIGSVIALGLIDPWLTVAFLVAFPVLALMLRGLARDSARIGADYGRAQGAIAARLLDALAGARTIAAAGTQDAERRRILAPLPVLRSHGDASWRMQARAAAQAAVIAPVLQVIVVAVAGLELSRHHLTPGGLVAASQYAMLAVGIGASTTMVARLGQARGGARRAAGLLAVPRPRYGTSRLPRAQRPGRLELRGVTVSHGGEAVLRGLNLTVPGGATVALVGRSGAGKSTLAEIAGRLADPDAGSVTLDGTDLRDLTGTALRQAVVYAFERPYLFGKTLREAIGFGPRDPRAGDIVAGAVDAQAVPFIERLPLAYETPVEAAPLSGGEVQRLGLARAFAHAGAARLLILDDATSSLDTVTEMLVSRALTQRLRGRTRLIVAHRAATAARADLVAWLDGGRIRAIAPHRELWRYADYRALFGSSEPGGQHLPGEQHPLAAQHRPGQPHQLGEQHRVGEQHRLGEQYQPGGQHHAGGTAHRAAPETHTRRADGFR